MSSNPGRKILSIDGCGFRGRTQLLVLKSLMDRMPKTMSKPCDVFDLICGTAAGGLIAILLGRLQMSCNDAIKAYDDLEEALFGKIASTSVSGILTANNGFDTTSFQNKLKDIITKNSRGNNFFKETADPKCKTLVTLMDKETFDDTDPIVLRSYSKPSRTDRPKRPEPASSLSHKWEIWQAAIGSVSCPRLFQPLGVGDSSFQAANASGFANPSMVAYIEAMDLWGSNAVLTLVSLGMGVRNRANNLDDWQRPGPPDDTTINNVLIGLGVTLTQASSDIRLKDFIRQTKRVATNTQVKDIRLDERMKTAGRHHMYYRFDPSSEGRGLVLVDYGANLRPVIDQTVTAFLTSDSNRIKEAAGKLEVGARGRIVVYQFNRAGRNGGTDFDGFLPTVGARLKTIRVWTKPFLCAIQLVYSFEGNDFSTGRWGGYGGELETFNLSPGEFIVSVDGNASAVINTVRFTKRKINGTLETSPEYGSRWNAPTAVVGSLASSIFKGNFTQTVSTAFGSVEHLLSGSTTRFDWSVPTQERTFIGLGWFEGRSGELIDALRPSFIRQDCVSHSS